jgi:hypothetical protein
VAIEKLCRSKSGIHPAFEEAVNNLPPPVGEFILQGRDIFADGVSIALQKARRIRFPPGFFAGGAFDSG